MTPTDFKEWRKRLGFNQDEAAVALGISRGSVVNYERGSRREDGRAVEIPLAIARACDSVALAVADERGGDLSVLSDEAQDRVRRIAKALPPEWLTP